MPRTLHKCEMCGKTGATVKVELVHREYGHPQQKRTVYVHLSC